MGFVLLSVTLAVQAEQDGDFTYTTDGSAVTITAYTGPGGAVVVPSTINGLPVTTIGDAAFDSCTSLVWVTIPNSITSIGDYAFSGCAALTGFTIPSGVTSIGRAVFNGCTSLAWVTIPNSVTSIGEAAFSCCSALSRVTIPDSVTSLGVSAFGGCTGLTNVTIPSSVNSIGIYAFDGCRNLRTITVAPANSVYSSVDGVLFNKSQTRLIRYMKAGYASYVVPSTVTAIGEAAFMYGTDLTRITIPASVTSIEARAFYSCVNLTSVTIPNSVTSIGEAAFCWCTNLTSVTIPNSVTSIGGSAFSWCTKLTSVTIPDRVTSIGDAMFGNCTNLISVSIPTSVRTIGNAAFESCTGLTSLTLPASVTSIGTRAFSFCARLTSVAIPAGVTTIGDGAFPACTRLTSITVDARNPAYRSANGVLFSRDLTKLIQYPAGKAGNYTIPASVTTIGDYAFADCASLTRVTIPSGVTNVGNRGFFGCSSLTTVTLPASVADIGDYAFHGCTSLTGVFFEGNAPNCPGSYTFFGDQLATLYHLSGTTGWGPTLGGRPTMLWDPSVPCSYALANGTSTMIDYLGPGSAVTIPRTLGGLPVTSIGNSAFYNCTGLTRVTIPDSVTSIGDEAFSNCTRLASVIIGNSVTSIGERAFSGCARLTNVTIPGSVTGIGVWAFANCTHLTSVTIRHGVTSIGEQAFYYCTSLTNVTIPDSVTSIAEAAFLDCKSLAHVTIPNSVTTIGKLAFADCARLSDVTIPGSVTSIGDLAFAKCTSLTRADFLGPAPAMGSGVFSGCTGGLTLYCVAGKSGFTLPTWYDCPCAIRPTPDFIITDVRLDPAVPAMGATFTALVTVQNVGTKTANGGSLYAWFDRPAEATPGLTPEKATTVGALQPGQAKVMRFSGLKAGTAAGDHTFHAWVDAKAQTDEVDETNNQRPLTWHAGRPDFIVSAVEFSPNPPPAGRSFAASVTVKNIGESAGDAGYVDVWAHAASAVALGPGLRGNKGTAAGTLLPGQEKVLCFTGMTAATDNSDQTFRAAVDSRTKTPESNEPNNQFTLPYLPGRPDFAVTKIEVAPNPAICGKTFTAYVTVVNAGTAPGDAGYLDIWLNLAPRPVAGSAIRGDKYASVGTLAVWQTKRLTFTGLRAGTAPGERILRALVDSRAKTAEITEYSNDSAEAYPCTPPP